MNNLSQNNLESKSELISKLFINAIIDSSDAVSKLLDEDVIITATEKIYGPLLKIIDHFEPSDEVYTAVAIKVEGDANGIMLFFTGEEEARKIADRVIKIKTTVSEQVSGEMTKSIIKEMVNIMFGAFLTTISDVSDLELVTSIPDLSTDMIKAGIDELCSEMALTTDKALAVITSFQIEPLDTTGELILLMDEDSVNKILERVK